MSGGGVRDSDRTQSLGGETMSGDVKRWSAGYTNNNGTVTISMVENEHGFYVSLFEHERELAELKEQVQELEVGIERASRLYAADQKTIAELKETWNRATRFVLPGEYDTGDSIAKHIEELKDALSFVMKQDTEKLETIAQKDRVIAMLTKQRNAELKDRYNFGSTLEQAYDAEIAALNNADGVKP